MNKIYKNIRFISVVLLAVSFGACNDQLATDDAQKISSEVILSSTAGLNMSLNSVYHTLLMSTGGSQNDACYQGLEGLCMFGRPSNQKPAQGSLVYNE